MKNIFRIRRRAKYDPQLDKLDENKLFPDKMARAKELLRKYGLPNDLKTQVG